MSGLSFFNYFFKIVLELSNLILREQILLRSNKIEKFINYISIYIK